MTLQERIDEIAAQEREWMELGHPVLVVSNTVEWWNERGIFTAEQLDAHFQGDPHESTSDRSYHARVEYDAWLDEMEREAIADEMSEEIADDFPFEPIYAIAAQHQSGWL